MGGCQQEGVLVDVAEGRRACAAGEGDAGDLCRFGRGLRRLSRGGEVGLTGTSATTDCREN